MNRTFVKAGATAAILAGLMGGVVAAPSVVYADAPAAEQQAVTEEQIQAMVDKIVAARPNVTAASWISSKADGIVTRVQGNLDKHYLTYLNLDGAGSTYTPAGDLKDLQGVYSALMPGQNLTARFTDPVKDVLLGSGIDDSGSSLMRAHWLNDGSHAGDTLVRHQDPLINAVNGLASWERSGVACVGSNRADKSEQPVYIQFDLGKSEAIKGFKLWRGSAPNLTFTSANTALVVSDDPQFSEGKTTVVYYSCDGKDKTDVFKLGVEPTDPYYVETAEGKDLFEGKKAAQGRYVRLYLNGATAQATNDKGNADAAKIHKGGENRILEIAIEGAGKVETSKLYDTTALEAAIGKANAILTEHANEYTAASLEALKNQVAEAQALLDSIKAGTATDSLGATDALLAQMVGNIDQASKDLVAAVHVTFDDKIEATDNVTVEVVKGEKVAKPADPKHPAGYTFAGWFLEKDGKTPFDFNAAVDKDVTVYAKWTLDAPLVQDNATRPSVPMTEIEDIAKKPTQSAMKLEPAKKKEPSKKDALPQTGDPSMLIAGASAAASAAAFAAARRRK